MLSKSAARAFFLLGTIGFSAVFLLSHYRHDTPRPSANETAEPD